MVGINLMILTLVAFGTLVECRSLHRFRSKKNAEEKGMEILGLETNDNQLLRVRRGGDGGGKRTPGSLKRSEIPRDINEISRSIEKSLAHGVLCNVEKAAPGKKTPCSKGNYEVEWSLVNGGTAADITFYSSKLDEGIVH